MTMQYEPSEDAAAAVTALMRLLLAFADQDALFSGEFVRDLVEARGLAVRRAAEQGKSVELLDSWSEALPEQLARIVGERRSAILRRQEAALLLRICPPPPAI